VTYKLGGEMKKVLLLIGSIMFAAFMASGCGTVASEKTVIVTQTVYNETPAASSTVASAPIAPAVFSGTGNLTTQKFPLGSGSARFNFKHTDGTANFIVTLMDDKGQTVNIVANAIGPTESTKVLYIPKDGNYMLDVMADGNWTISVQEE